MVRLRSLLTLSIVALTADAFKYDINDVFESSSRCSYTEGWMFGTKDGPRGAPQGQSYVNVDLKVTAVPPAEDIQPFNISMMFYRSKVLDFGIDDNLNICPHTPVVSSSMTDVQVLSFPANPVSEMGQVVDSSYVADVRGQRTVAEAGLQHAFIQVCPYQGDFKTITVEGHLTFHNPYGYLPGMYFGCLPFELFRVLASVALGVFFMSTMWRHRATLLPVHHMILGVIVLGTFEALAWLTAYTYMNRTGKPYCCPYPGTVILAMAMEVLRRTTSRFMLLMICLGYGITRVALERRVMIAVVALTAAFLASGILQLASSVAAGSHVRNGADSDGDAPLLAIPALLTDMIYLFWIYTTLANMIKELKELNETYKLKMFKALAWTLGTFVSLFASLTVAMLAAEGSEQQSWEWKWEWVQVVSWEILNFCMLAAVSIIWRPSSRSAMLAYSKQLATNEIAAEEADGVEIEAVEFQGPGAGHFTIGEDDDDDDDDDGGEEASSRGDYGDRLGEGKTDSTSTEDSRANNGKMYDQGYSLADFEPQRHTDLT